MVRALFALAAAAAAHTLLVKNAHVVNAHEEIASTDILVKDGKIAKVAANISAAADETVDAAGNYVLPGGIDPHTHLEMPFMGQVTADDYHTGHRAALAGGTTLHIDFALPVDGSLVKGYYAWRKRGEKANMDFAFHMAVTGWSDQVAKEMEILVADHRVNSFKFFLAYKGALMINDEQLVKALVKCKQLGALAMVHAENGDAVAIGQQMMIDRGITGPEGHALSRPAALEGEATNRAAQMAGFVNTPLYVVHVMSEDAASAIQRAKEQGIPVIGEAVAAGLLLDESMMWDEDFDRAATATMSPPIRKLAKDGIYLRNAVKSKLISLVATDHAVFDRKQKRVGRDDFRILPNGTNGLEERIPLLWESFVASGDISVSEFARITSTEAARIFNLYPAKGLIAEGSDGDFYVMSKSAKKVVSEKTHHSAMDINVYEGFTGGKVLKTVSRGKLAFDGVSDKFFTKQGDGQFVLSPPFSPYLFNKNKPSDASIYAFGKAPVSRAGDKKAEL